MKWQLRAIAHLLLDIWAGLVRVRHLLGIKAFALDGSAAQRRFRPVPRKLGTVQFRATGSAARIAILLSRFRFLPFRFLLGLLCWLKESPSPSITGSVRLSMTRK